MLKMNESEKDKIINHFQYLMDILNKKDLVIDWVNNLDEQGIDLLIEEYGIKN